ncbi:MAG: bifunctional demethylmenaquinone methyltransferase/2-methoxy-6-polyprenyl-1,4-benzoquinol methylase UbiE [Ignavibacteria bacterium]|nr:bifunctional demethylmenaquinone methyltransferase/2-methoxy-6-polyprenyl-1,4-benzoquinol methylase UbiE [Ignavibacteria bacterium]
MTNQVSNFFRQIAKDYDLLNDVMSLGVHRIWFKKALKHIPQKDSLKILDLATGTGKFSFEIKKKFKNSRIVGLDNCENMLSIARKQNQKFGNSIEFILGNALDIPFRDNTFDVVTSSFGIRNFELLDKTFQEIHRVLKPKGKFIILEFGKPSNEIFRKIYTIYQKLIIVNLAGLISRNRDAYKYLVTSINSFLYGNELTKFISNTNLFEEVKFFPLSFGIAYIYTGIKKTNCSLP